MKIFYIVHTGLDGLVEDGDPTVVGEEEDVDTRWFGFVGDLVIDSTRALVATLEESCRRLMDPLFLSSSALVILLFSSLIGMHTSIDEPEFLFKAVCRAQSTWSRREMVGSSNVSSIGCVWLSSSYLEAKGCKWRLMEF